jgi:quinol monooxygenase YgiN
VHAQIIRSSAAREQRAEMNQIVIEQVIPALRDEPGCAGAMSFVDRQSGNSMLIVLWATVEDARRTTAWHTPRLREAFSRMAAVSTQKDEAVTIWEVDLRV